MVLRDEDPLPKVGRVRVGSQWGNEDLGTLLLGGR